ncbi:MAG: hypothetical protein M5T61_09855 [Acidimicrobiia bacterium]|nr:hypothetical protein [Acidimicrobiia bacterium]
MAETGSGSLERACRTGTPDPTPDTLVMRDADGGASLTTLGLTAPSGTAPPMVESSTLVANLNADTVDGKHASELGVSATTALTPTSITLTGIRDMVSIFGLAAGTYLFLATGEVRNDSTTAGDYLDVAFALDISEEESDLPRMRPPRGRPGYRRQQDGPVGPLVGDVCHAAGRASEFNLVRRWVALGWGGQDETDGHPAVLIESWRTRLCGCCGIEPTAPSPG